MYKPHLRFLTQNQKPKRCGLYMCLYVIVIIIIIIIIIVIVITILAIILKFKIICLLGYSIHPHHSCPGEFLVTVMCSVYMEDYYSFRFQRKVVLPFIQHHCHKEWTTKEMKGKIIRLHRIKVTCNPITR